VKFLCGSCRTKYQISDEKVRGKILTIRCKKCGAKVLVRESLSRDAAEGTVVAPVADEASLAASGMSPLSSAFNKALKTHETNDIPVASASQPPEVAHEWYTAVDGQQFGPFSFEQVQLQIRGGQLIGRHYVWHEAMDNWTRIRDVAALEPYLPATTVPPPPPPPADSSARGGLPPATASNLFPEDLAAGSAAEVPLVVPESGAVESQTESDDAFPVDAEDLFASVPRASAAELVPKESTRFFVKAAGVNNAKSRSRLGVIIGGIAALILVSVVGAWAGGMVSLPGIGNPFTRAGNQPALYDGEAEDPNSVKGLLAREKEKQQSGGKASRATGRRPRGRAVGASDESLEFEYVDADELSDGPRGSRGRGLESISIGELGTTGGANADGIIEAVESW